MPITAKDVQDMVTHWLGCPLNGYFGSSYGSSLTDKLLTPQSTGGVEAELNKMQDDVPILRQLPSDVVSAWVERRGPDQANLFIDVAGSLLIADPKPPRGVAPAASSAAELSMSPLTLTVSVLADGTVTLLPAAVVTASVVVGGANVTASSVFTISNGPGVTMTAGGTNGQFSLTAATAGTAASYADILVTGPFAGQLSRRITIARQIVSGVPSAMVAIHMPMSANFTDLALVPHTTAAEAGAVISSGSTLFGLPMGDFTGSATARVNVTTSAALRLTSPWGMRMWAKMPASGAERYFVVSYAAGSNWVWLAREANGALQCYILGNQFSTAAGVIPADTLVHIEFSMDATYMARAFIDGALVQSVQLNVGSSSQPFDTPWWIGGPPAGFASLGSQGYIGDFQLAIGDPIHTAAFTVPSGPLTPP
jgi:Concanavalin A-like lectin/glucanases superfamily